MIQQQINNDIKIQYIRYTYTSKYQIYNTNFDVWKEVPSKLNNHDSIREYKYVFSQHLTRKRERKIETNFYLFLYIFGLATSVEYLFVCQQVPK